MKNDWITGMTVFSDFNIPIDYDCSTSFWPASRFSSFSSFLNSTTACLKIAVLLFFFFFFFMVDIGIFSHFQTQNVLCEPQFEITSTLKN